MLTEESSSSENFVEHSDYEKKESVDMIDQQTSLSNQNEPSGLPVDFDEPPESEIQT